MISSQVTFSMDKTLIILVHGTWGGRKESRSTWRQPMKSKSQLWFEENSSFRNAIKNIQKSFDIIPFFWNGFNRAHDRTEASRRLASFIETKMLSTHDGILKYKKLIIIGHSHGGNISLKSLDYIDETKFSVNNENVCVLTMATPFFSFGQQIFKPSNVVIWYGSASILAILRCTYLKHAYDQLWNLGVLCDLVILFLVTPVAFRIGNHFTKGGTYDEQQTKFGKFISEKIRGYVIRTSRDEAAFGAGLNSSTFVVFNRTLNKVLDGIAKPINALPVPKNAILQSIVFAIYFIIMLFAFFLVQVISRVSPEESMIYISMLFQIPFMMILSTWSLYLISFVGLGMPMNGMKDLDVSIDSAPDADFNIKVQTITRSSSTMSGNLRHSLHSNQDCINLVKEILITEI